MTMTQLETKSTRIDDFSDPMTLRRAFGHYPSGVAAIAAEVNGTKQVVVASSFMVGISLDPPLVQFAIQHSSETWPSLRQADRLGVSVIGSSQGGHCRQLASKDRAGRFNSIDIVEADGGALLLGDAPVQFECSLFAEYPAGDHDVILLKVEALTLDQNSEPIVFHGSRFRELIEPIAD